MKIRTLFISDIHLGTKKSQPEQLLKILKKYNFENLIIIGDFIDLTSLKRKFYWRIEHFNVIQKILKLNKNNVNIFYILGNHDHYLRNLIKDENLNLGNISISDDLIYKTLKNEKIYICHGDKFDGFIRLHPFLYFIGDFAYEFSFRINKIYNTFRKIFGLNYWSLSKYLKTKVKNAISYINDFKYLSIKEIEKNNCDSIMIGHLHTPSIENIMNKKYYNTGDFCETCSYLYEDLNGDIILKYC